MSRLIFVLFVGGCSAAAPSAPVAVGSTTSTTTPGVGAPLSLPAHGAMSVGAPVPAGAAVSLATVMAKPDDYAGKTILVEGTVRAACRKKGCWMELAPSKSATSGCRVRFKDYGFFVPTDSAGAEARLSGEVSVRTLTKEEVAHLEGEGATLAKSADGSARAVEITATGVELMRM